MPRPKQCLCKRIRFDADALYFKPRGIPVQDLETIELSLEEIEAFRLRHVKNMDQREAAKKIGTSTSTYQRLLYSAYEKIADALTGGKAIKITKHNPHQS